MQNQQAAAAPTSAPPQQLVRSAELSNPELSSVPVAAAPTPYVGPLAPVAPPAVQLAQTSPQTPPMPRSRNEAPTEASAAESYAARATGYWNDAVDYLRGGLGSLSSHLPDFPVGWQQGGDDPDGRTREQLLVDAMNAAGFDLVSVARDGTLITSAVYTFRQQRRPSASDRLLATKLAAELSAAYGGLSGYLEQVMIKTALESTDATLLSVKTFELQTRPYPWLRSVAGPRSATR